MNVSATMVAFYVPVFIMIVLYFQVKNQTWFEPGQKCEIFFNIGLPWNYQKKKSFEFRWAGTSENGENACRKDPQ